jgi:hypothetical protein
MNLLELPVLFHVVCLLMLTTGRSDSVQVPLAWVFDVADAVLYLANATWVTGVILPVDGGVDAGGDGSYHGPKERLADGTA